MKITAGRISARRSYVVLCLCKFKSLTVIEMKNRKRETSFCFAVEKNLYRLVYVFYGYDFDFAFKLFYL